MFRRKKKNYYVSDNSDRLSRLGPWIIRILSLLLIAAIAVCILYATGVFKTSSAKVTANVTAFGLKDIGELATQAGYYTSVQGIEKEKEFLGITLPGSKSSSVFSYSGTVKAGFNFADIDIELNDEEHVIYIHLPEVRILSVEIDPNSLVVYSSHTSFITPLEVSDFGLSLAKLTEKVQETAIANHILDNALDNAKVLIRGFLAGCYDLNVYRIEFEETK